MAKIFVQTHEDTAAVEISVGLEREIESGEDEIRHRERDDEESRGMSS